MDNDKKSQSPASGEDSEAMRERNEDFAEAPMNPGRREVVRKGLKIAFVAPLISTFFAQDAQAYSLSCYPNGHACPGAEPCCNGLTCTANICQ